MKKIYVKPSIEIVDFNLEDKIMNVDIGDDQLSDGGYEDW